MFLGFLLLLVFLLLQAFLLLLVSLLCNQWWAQSRKKRSPKATPTFGFHKKYG